MTPRERADQSLASSFERYLQDKGKGRGGDGGNYRRNAARELERFAEWAAGDRGADDWAGIVPNDVAAYTSMVESTRAANDRFGEEDIDEWLEHAVDDEATE